MSTSRRAAAAWLSGAVVFLTAEAAAAWAYRPDYSYASDFISDLGVPGDRSPLAWLMNTGFCLQGSLFLLGAVLWARGAARAFVVAAGANAVGNYLIAFCHSGSATHAVGAVVAIVGGNAALLAGSSTFGDRLRALSLILGLTGLLAFLVFVAVLNDRNFPVGIAERGSVYSITVWQTVCAAVVLSRRASSVQG